MVHRLSGDLWYPMDYRTGDTPLSELLRLNGLNHRNGTKGESIPVSEAVPGTLATDGAPHQDAEVQEGGPCFK